MLSVGQGGAYRLAFGWTLYHSTAPLAAGKGLAADVKLTVGCTLMPRWHVSAAWYQCGCWELAAERRAAYGTVFHVGIAVLCAARGVPPGRTQMTEAASSSTAVLTQHTGSVLPTSAFLMLLFP